MTASDFQCENGIKGNFPKVPKVPGAGKNRHKRSKAAKEKEGKISFRESDTSGGGLIYSSNFGSVGAVTGNGKPSDIMSQTLTA
jgi:hypothetical protein